MKKTKKTKKRKRFEHTLSDVREPLTIEKFGRAKMIAVCVCVCVECVDFRVVGGYFLYVIRTLHSNARTKFLCAILILTIKIIFWDFPIGAFDRGRVININVFWKVSFHCQFFFRSFFCGLFVDRSCQHQLTHADGS